MLRRWRFQARRQLLALVSVAVAAGVTAGIAAAQSDGFLYEKELDPKRNPTPAYREEQPGPPLLEFEKTFAEPLVRLPALVTDAGADGVHDARDARIIEGTPASPGEWKSAVNLKIGYTSPDGRELGTWCGGSVIDEHWVLTAAHCVFRADAGGLRPLQWVTAYASDVRFQKGTPLRVKAVLVHRTYDGGWFVNDLALLNLERPYTNAPRQKLAARTGLPMFLTPGTKATIVGWGRTKSWGPGERPPDDPPSVLLKGFFPIADKESCDERRRRGRFPKGPGTDRPMTDAEFCAGDVAGKSNTTCNGDSGGPLFVASPTGEHIQAGVVSWGSVGCPKNVYAVYANVGHFEDWIRRHVPNAVFVSPQPDLTSGPLQQIAGVEPGGPPSPRGQCSVDIDADGALVNRVKVGAHLTVHVTTGVTGHLAVFNRIKGDGRAPGDKVVQLFPNSRSSRAVAGPLPTAVRAGDVVAIPDPRDTFSLEVTPPVGRYEIIALVVPEGVNLAEITRPFQGMSAIGNFDGVLAEIAVRTRQVAETGRQTPRAVCTRQFDVVAR
jgi:secreted trypsin-like serine protease